MRRIGRMDLRQPEQGIAGCAIDGKLTERRGERSHRGHGESAERHSVAGAEQYHAAHARGLGAQQAERRAATAPEYI